MSTRSRKGPSAPKKDGTPPPGRAASEAEAPSFSGLQPVRAVVGVNNIGVAPGSLMDVFDPAGVLIPAAKKSPSVARDLAMVGGGLLRLGGAAVDAHLDVLRRERAALDQVEALKVQLAEREAGLCYASERAVEALRRMTPAEGRALLVEAGIITSDGELTSEYR